MTKEVDIRQYSIPNDVSINSLDCKTAFTALTEQEKAYAHFLSRASWDGALICLLQTSPESPGIFMLLQRLFSAQPIQELQETATKADGGPTEEEFTSFLVYAAAVYSNLGNYKSFGDTKFIPLISKEKFYVIIKASKAFSDDAEGVEMLWKDCADAIYSLEPRLRSLGLGSEGLSTYYSSNCDKQDAEFVQNFMQDKEISPYNTRLFKTVDENGQVSYDLRLASVLSDAECRDDENCQKDTVAPLIGQHEYKHRTISVSRGDYSGLLKRVVEMLSAAKKYVANSLEEAMLSSYIHCFTTGSIDAHKDGSLHWIKNKGPIVESYIGFIESYRDPFGVRGEWEGFVAIVNKAMSAKFAALVESAEQLLSELPWPSEYEKDKFLRPDFTSLDVIAFGTSGIPLGINIPNYDDIRQKHGFKNVSLGNVLTAAMADKKITFLKEEDQELYAKLRAPSFEVQVGLHELLGHGSGKLFCKDKNGDFNFDVEKVKHTETGSEIGSWYGPGETYDAKFPVISSSYEECRAECVGIYLCLSKDVLRIFGHEGSAGDDIVYINWLNMVRAGVLALEFFTPETNKWRQAHMQARFAILRVLLEAGEDLVKISRTTGSDDKPDLEVSLDRAKIEPVGKPAIGAFLRKLQVYKATADFESAKSMYDFYSSVNEDFANLRETVLDRKLPRRMYVQPHIVEEDGNISLREYESSARGIVESFIDRFPSRDEVLERLWRAEHEYHQY